MSLLFQCLPLCCRRAPRTTRQATSVTRCPCPSTNTSTRTRSPCTRAGCGRRAMGKSTMSCEGCRAIPAVGWGCSTFHAAPSPQLTGLAAPSLHWAGVMPPFLQQDWGHRPYTCCAISTVGPARQHCSCSMGLRTPSRLAETPTFFSAASKRA